MIRLIELTVKETSGTLVQVTDLPILKQNENYIVLDDNEFTVISKHPKSIRTALCLDNVLFIDYDRLETVTEKGYYLKVYTFKTKEDARKLLENSIQEYTENSHTLLRSAEIPLD